MIDKSYTTHHATITVSVNIDGKAPEGMDKRIFNLDWNVPKDEDQRHFLTQSEYDYAKRVEAYLGSQKIQENHIRNYLQTVFLAREEELEKIDNSKIDLSTVPDAAIYNRALDLPYMYTNALYAALENKLMQLGFESED